jgi:hypothetical protein
MAGRVSMQSAGNFLVDSTLYSLEQRVQYPSNTMNAGEGEIQSEATVKQEVSPVCMTGGFSSIPELVFAMNIMCQFEFQIHCCFKYIGAPALGTLFGWPVKLFS